VSFWLHGDVLLIRSSADGLRADLVFTPTGSPKVPLAEGEVMAPYLRSIVNERGAFGLSHTRVPTESRPGRKCEP
jgi:phosphatidylinositol glycan class N